MNTTLGKFIPVHSVAIAHLGFNLPLAATTTLAGFKDLLSSGLGMLIMVLFLFAVVLFTAGVMSRGRNPEMSKWCFVSAFLLALGVAIVSVLFAISGNSGAIIEPKFS